MTEDKARVSRVPAWVNPGSVIGTILVALFCISWAKSCAYRSRCGAHELFAQTMFEERRLVAEWRLKEDGHLPPTVLALFSEPSYTQGRNPASVFDGYCCKYPTRAVKVGEVSLFDVLSHKVTHEQVVRQGEAVNQGLHGWEAFEMLGYLRDESAWQSNDPALIVFWMVYPKKERAGATVFLGYAGATPAEHVFWNEDLTPYLDASDAIAARLGIDPAPPELRAWCRD